MCTDNSMDMHIVIHIHNTSTMHIISNSTNNTNSNLNSNIIFRVTINIIIRSNINMNRNTDINITIISSISIIKSCNSMCINTNYMYNNVYVSVMYIGNVSMNSIVTCMCMLQLMYMLLIVVWLKLMCV